MMKKNYTSGGIFGFVIGLIIVIGFALWTVDLFQNSEIFNPWTILTMFIAGVGLTMIFERDVKRKTKGEFFRIEFHDKDNFIFGLFIGGITLMISISLVFIYKDFTWGLFVALLLLLIGLFSVISNIKFKKIK